MRFARGSKKKSVSNECCVASLFCETPTGPSCVCPAGFLSTGHGRALLPPLHQLRPHVVHAGTPGALPAPARATVARKHGNPASTGGATLVYGFRRGKSLSPAKRGWYLPWWQLNSPTRSTFALAVFPALRSKKMTPTTSSSRCISVCVRCSAAHLSSSLGFLPTRCATRP